MVSIDKIKNIVLVFYLFLICFLFFECRKKSSYDVFKVNRVNNTIKIETGLTSKDKRYFKFLTKKKYIAQIEISDPLFDSTMWYISTKGSFDYNPKMIIYGITPNGFRKGKALPLKIGKFYKLEVMASGGPSARVFYFRHEDKIAVISNSDKPPFEIMSK